jgi:hypothetical protein
VCVDSSHELVCSMCAAGPTGAGQSRSQFPQTIRLGTGFAKVGCSAWQTPSVSFVEQLPVQVQTLNSAANWAVESNLAVRKLLKLPIKRLCPCLLALGQ